MRASFEISKEHQIPLVLEEIIPLLKHKIILLNGNLGAGKTTFVKYLLKALGSEDTVSSPTYSIVNEYFINNEKAYHFDLYRLENLEEIYDIGIEDYLNSGSYCFIEWPEIYKDELEQEYHEFEIILEDDQRKLNIRV